MPLRSHMLKEQQVSRDASLANKYRVSDYLRDVGAQNRQGISDAIHRRFKERYLDPISHSETHGFTRMAVSCLMIEALESFRRGLPDMSKRGQSEYAFCSFFDAHSQFASFRGQARDFYKGVRCGILHQAETTLGWRIRRDSEDLLQLVDGVRTINAEMFVDALAEALDQYRDQLKATNWDGELWKSLRTKMKAVCKNCEP